MQLKKRFVYSGIASAAVLVTSIMLPIIPCQKVPNVPGLAYKWSLCSLNPDQVSSLGSITKYFGYTSSMQDAYMLTVLITFIAAMIFFHFTAKKHKAKGGK